MSPSHAVAIPSWKGAALLRRHLPSVLAEARLSGASGVVVCDDGADAETAAVIAADFPSVRLHVRPERGGFSRSATDAVIAAEAEIVVLLNNDMEVHAGCFGALVAPFGRHPNLFAAVPRIVRSATGLDEAHTRLHFRRGVVATSVGGDPSRAPDYACGGAMAVRRSVFLELGGFDPLFAPFYWEDVDLSYRARKRGMEIAFVPEARVDHDHGATIGGRFPRAEVSRVYERNRLLFTWKNLTDPGLFRRHLAGLVPKLLWDVAAHPAFVRGALDALARRAEVSASREAERRQARVSDRELLR
ncbi:MAG TPA: glycosyltransferase [Candidatus Polarisedimenticolaceae bacterium]|nr:glycosyltransferase [Candidatus Polarisedimenticolaceae bacterium]